MTITASFLLDGSPVVFGDLLISGETYKENDINTPFAGNVRELFENSGWGIRSLRQKVVLINKHCVLAWSGQYISARNAIDELKKISEKTTLSGSFVHDFFANHDELNGNDVAFVGWVYEESLGHFTQIGHNHKTFEAGKFGTFYVQGTGNDTIENLVSLFNRMETMETGVMSPSDRATCFGLSITGLLIESEYRGGVSAQNLLNFYGGGYEIVIFSNGTFKKVSNFNHIIWNVRFDNEKPEIISPLLIAHQSYYNDILVLNIRNISYVAQNKPIVDPSVHYVRPPFLTETKPPSRPDQTDLNEKLKCHVIFVEKIDVGTRGYHFCVENVTSSHSIETYDANGGLAVRINKQFIDRMLTDIRNKFR